MTRQPGHKVPSGPTVVWDLGNVLIDWQPARAIAAGVGEDEAARFLAADDFDFYAYNAGPDAGQSWAAAELEVSRTHPHWLSHARAYREYFPLSLTAEIPATRALVLELASAGVPQVGLTNWSAELFHYAPELFEVVRWLDDVVVSGIEGTAKPDPEIYQITATRASSDPGDLIFIDDRESNVTAAREQGWQALVFDQPDRLRTELIALGLPLRAPG